MSMSMSMSSCITPCTQPRAFVLCEDDGERGLWETGCGGGGGTGGRWPRNSKQMSFQPPSERCNAFCFVQCVSSLLQRVDATLRSDLVPGFWFVS